MPTSQSKHKRNEGDVEHEEEYEPYNWKNAPEPPRALRHRDSWKLKCGHRATQYARITNREVYGYVSEAHAKSELNLFWYAVHRDNAAKWISLDRQKSEEENRGRNVEYTVTMPPKKLNKKCRGDDVLSVAQAKEKKAKTMAEREERKLLHRPDTHYKNVRLPKLKALIAEAMGTAAGLNRKVLLLETTDLIIRTGEEMPRESIEDGEFSQTQVMRSVMQASVVGRMCRLRVQRLTEENNLVATFLFNNDRVVLNEGLSKICKTESIHDLAKTALDQLDYLKGEESFNGGVPVSTAVGWWQEFHRMGRHGFMEDERGKHKDDNWLEQWGLKERLRLYLSVQKQISVRSVLGWLNEQPPLLLKAEEDKLRRGEPAFQYVDRHGVPFSQTTSLFSTHRFMGLVGAKWSRIAQNYYTEKEEAKYMLKHPTIPIDRSMYSKLVLSKCSDFQEEKSALADLIESRGHILILGVKCHPEMAGLGVEYVFGYSKRYFRKHNDCKTCNLEKNVRDSFRDDVMTLDRLWKFERRTWLYQQMYLDLGSRTGAEEEVKITYHFLEKTMMDLKTTHRNIMEIDRTFLMALEE